MGKKVKYKRIAENPAWAWAVLALIVSMIFFGFLNDEGHRKSDFFLASFTIAYDVFIAVSCYVICMVHPKSVWYTPVICSVQTIGSIIWKFPFWTDSTMVLVIMGIGIGGAVLAAIVGSKKGRRMANSG